MYIRCLACQSSSWLESLEAGSKAQSVYCDSCGREYTLDIPSDLGESQREQYQRALGFAEENILDLPSAYSVMLGIMTLDEARGLKERSVEASAKAEAARTETIREAENARKARSLRSAAAIKPPAFRKAKRIPKVSRQAEQRQEPRYDSGFQEAVEQGRLTAKQAMERGNRRLMATRLARTQRLPMQLAYRVVDNRLSLHAALRKRSAKEKASAKPPPPPITKRQQAWTAVGGAVVLAVVIFWGIQLWNGFTEESRAVEKLAAVTEQRQAARPADPPAPEASTAVGPAPAPPPDAVLKDDDGRVLAVTGPDPQTVLIRFCESASESNRFEPVELASSVPPFPGHRLGVFRDFNRLNSLFAIRIRMDSRSHRWKAGDGRRPIAAFEAPGPELAGTRIPVTVR